MKKQTKLKEVASPIVRHDFEDNILTIKFKEGKGTTAKFHQGRITIESDKDGPIQIIINPFEV